MDSYDLIVIGTGTAAQVAATRVRRAGRSVAVIDHQQRGVTGELRINWKELIAFKRTFTDPVPKKREESFAKQGIDALHGMARFSGPDTLLVEGRALKGRNCCWRTPGPTRLSWCGARHHQLLTRFDPELVGWLMEKFSEIGIEVQTGTAVEAIERAGSGFRVRARTKSQEIAIEADLVVHAAGRAPDIDALNLAAAGVAVEHGQIVLNEFLHSVSYPAVYAAGDAAAKGPPLTPVSSHDGKVVAANLLEGNWHRPDYRGVPSVAFTLPPIAAVGLSEAAARNQVPKLRVNSGKATDWYTARRVGEAVYGYKTLVEAESGRILGAHLVGPHADEVINLFGLAIRHNLTADDLKTTMFAYPTGASDIGDML